MDAHKPLLCGFVAYMHFYNLKNKNVRLVTCGKQRHLLVQNAYYNITQTPKIPARLKQ